jgi:hypothetical protein
MITQINKKQTKIVGSELFIIIELDCIICLLLLFRIEQFLCQKLVTGKVYRVLLGSVLFDFLKSKQSSKTILEGQIKAPF